MDQIKVTVGRIVEYFPGTGTVQLPNGMQTAPAIVTQVFEKHANLTVLVADPNGQPVVTAWSISHKSESMEGMPYWDWFQKV